MFVPGRCYDQIRLQLGYGQANVKIVGVSAGLTQGPDGATHQSLDDVALTRQIPNMTVLVPADATEAYQAVLAAADLPGPAYLRLGRYPTPILFGDDYHFQVGAMPQLCAGSDLLLLGTGMMTAFALDLAAILADEGLHAAVYNVPTIKPFNRSDLLTAAAGKRLVVTFEEHSIIGGLGSAVAEIMAEEPDSPPLLRIGVRTPLVSRPRLTSFWSTTGLHHPKWRSVSSIAWHAENSEGTGAFSCLCALICCLLKQGIPLSQPILLQKPARRVSCALWRLAVQSIWC
jgi:transketolase C-terminal domain/subunit